MSVYSHMVREQERQEMINEEREIIQKKTREEEDQILLALQPINTNERSYGIMKLKYQYYVINHQILTCSNEFQQIVDFIKHIIKTLIEKKVEVAIDYMIYQVDNINPKLVSYNIIKSSNYPYVILCYNPFSRNIVDLYGNSKLAASIWDGYKEFSNFHNYGSTLKSNDKAELKRLCKENNLKFNFLTSKDTLIRRLVKHKFRSLAQ